MADLGYSTQGANPAQGLDVVGVAVAFPPEESGWSLACLLGPWLRQRISGVPPQPGVAPYPLDLRGHRFGHGAAYMTGD